MATMTLCNTVFMVVLLAALSTCHGNAFGAWSGKQRQRNKKLAIYRSWPWISNCWEWDSNSGLSAIEPRALTTRPRRLGANLRRDATSCLLFLNQSVLADFDHRKKTTGFKTRSLSGTSNYSQLLSNFKEISIPSKCISVTVSQQLLPLFGKRCGQHLQRSPELVSTWTWWI